MFQGLYELTEEVCGGGLEYLQRSPEGRKRRRKENPMPKGITGPPCSWEIWIWRPGPLGCGSLIWDSKIWSWVLRDFDPWLTVLARPGSNCKSKLQTYPLIREGAPYQEIRSFQTGNKIWSLAPDGSPIPRQTGWLTVVRKLTWS
jgi:hypothetical protein